MSLCDFCGNTSVLDRRDSGASHKSIVQAIVGPSSSGDTRNFVWQTCIRSDRASTYRVVAHCLALGGTLADIGSIRMVVYIRGMIFSEIKI